MLEFSVKIRYHPLRRQNPQPQPGCARRFLSVTSAHGVYPDRVGASLGYPFPPALLQSLAPGLPVRTVTIPFTINTYKKAEEGCGTAILGCRPSRFTSQT